MKKILCLAFSILLTITCISGCGNKSKKETDKKLNIVATIFPQYDWTREILGDKIDSANLTLLLDSGVDLHSYQPTAKDIVTVSNCDLFIYVGGESDEWVKDVLKESKNKNMTKLSLMDSIKDGALTEETVEGMQETEEDNEEDKEEEYDEHIWLSINNAMSYCKTIAKELANLDSKNEETYIENANNYIQKLDELDKEYKSAVSNAKKDTLLFADRFPFRYLTNDYNLKYFAAFKGCSAESEASFETISFLANKVNELDLAVIALEGSDQKIAKTVIKTAKKSDSTIYTLDSMQTVTSKDVKKGKTYLSITKANLEQLTKALS